MHWIYWWHLGSTAPAEVLIRYVPPLHRYEENDEDFIYGDFRFPHSIALADPIVTRSWEPGGHLTAMAERLIADGIDFVLVGRNHGSDSYRIWAPREQTLEVVADWEDPVVGY